MNKPFKQIRDALDAASHVLVITHLDPDGDAFGSMTTVGLAAQQLGKRVNMIVDKGMGRRFSYLALADRVREKPEPDFEPDLLIAVDCGDESRMGNAFYDLPEPRPTVINIDHHVTNTKFGAINWVDADAASTTEMLYYMLPEIGVSINQQMAVSLLTGLVTDTLGFRTLSVTARTFEAASGTMQAGADLPTIMQRAISSKSFAALEMWRVGLSNLKMKKGLIWTTISKKERAAIKYPGGGSSGLVSFMSDIDSAAISAALTELDDGRVAVSFRCRPPYNVAEIALSLGGGGHPMAAGTTLDGPLQKAEALVVEMAQEAIREQADPADDY